MSTDYEIDETETLDVSGFARNDTIERQGLSGAVYVAASCGALFVEVAFTFDRDAEVQTCGESGWEKVSDFVDVLEGDDESAVQERLDELIESLTDAAIDKALDSRRFVLEREANEFVPERAAEFLGTGHSGWMGAGMSWDSETETLTMTDDSLNATYVARHVGEGKFETTITDHLA